MSNVLLVIATILFVLALFAVTAGPLAPIELVYLGLACFAAAHLPLP